MKRKFILLVGLACAAAYFSGCGDNNNKAEELLRLREKENEQQQKYTEENTTEKAVSYTYLMDTEKRIITKEDLEGKQDIEIRLIKNEILARHGYVFSDDEVMKNYFSNQVWYEPNPDFSQKDLTGIELENFNFINKYMNDMEEASKKAEEKAKEPQTVIVEVPSNNETANKSINSNQSRDRIYYCCASDFATLRVEPSTRSAPLAKVYTREAVTFLGTDGPFYYVRYNGVSGYVLSKFLSENIDAPLNYDDR